MESRSTEAMPHLIQIDANLHGDDYIIGDVHGNVSTLERVMAELKEHDRLFIVGDLVDRGMTNVEVIDYIAKYPGRIICIRGNHEDLCLDAIGQLEQKYSHFKSRSIKDIEELISAMLSSNILAGAGSGMNKINIHVKNGGGWLVRLFKKEIDAGLISQDEHGNIRYQAKSSVSKILNFMRSLPYIIYVNQDIENGRLAFKMVHADMPFNEEVLIQRFKDNQLQMNEREIAYAIWARDPVFFENTEISIRDNKIGFNESVCYVGHSIVSDQDMAVREDTNTIDTDVGSHALNVALLVNHTKRQAKAIGNERSGLDDIVARVNQHLHLQPELLLNRAVVDGESLQDIEKILATGANPEKLIRIPGMECNMNAVSMVVLFHHDMGQSEGGEEVRDDYSEMFDLFEKNCDFANDHAHVFYVAIKCNNVEIVRRIIDIQPMIVHQRNADGDYSLRVAAVDNHQEIFDLLLERGADISLANTNVDGSLYVKDVVDLTLDEIIKEKLIKANISGVYHMQQAIRDKDKSRVAELIERNPAIVNRRDAYRHHLLRVAAIHGSPEIVALLLQKGADIDQIDKKLDGSRFSVSVMNYIRDDNIRQLLKEAMPRSGPLSQSSATTFATESDRSVDDSPSSVTRSKTPGK